MLYLSLFAKSFQRTMAYRSATLAGLATNFFFGMLRAYTFIAVYAASGQAEIGGFSLRDAVTFTALTQALGAPLGVINWWWEVMRTIRSGEIVSDLVQPFHFLGFWMARDLGRAVFPFVFRGLPIVALYPLFFPVSWPPTPVHWALFLWAVAVAMAVSFCWRFWVNLWAFWLVDAEGVGRFVWLTTGLLSGFMVPVAFFPDWLQALARFTPLPATINTPVEV